MTKKNPRPNMARCRICEDVIESTHVHDFVRCQCGAIFVDGGRQYWRYGWEKEGAFERLTERPEPTPQRS